MNYKEFKRIVKLDILNDNKGCDFNSLVKYLVDIKERGEYVEKFNEKIKSYYIEYEYMGFSIFNNFSKYYENQYGFRSRFLITFNEKFFDVYGHNIYINKRNDFLDFYVRDYLEFDKYVRDRNKLNNDNL